MMLLVSHRSYNHFPLYFHSALYTILADSATLPCSVIVLCNKQDLTTAKSAEVIKTSLEKEM